MCSLVVAVVVYGVMFTKEFEGPDDDAFLWEFGGSFYLTIVSLLLAFVAAILCTAQVSLY